MAGYRHARGKRLQRDTSLTNRVTFLNERLDAATSAVERATLAFGFFRTAHKRTTAPEDVKDQAATEIEELAKRLGMQLFGARRPSTWKKLVGGHRE